MTYAGLADGRKSCAPAHSAQPYAQTLVTSLVTAAVVLLPMALFSSFEYLGPIAVSTTAAVLLPTGLFALRERRQRLRAERTARAQGEQLSLTRQDAEEVEADLRRTQLLLRSVVDGIAAPVYAKDRQGRYLFINAAASRIVGKSDEDVRGKDDLVAFPGNEARAVMEGDARVMNSARALVYEESVTSASGTRIDYLATKAPLVDTAGNVIGLVGISLDISERKMAERALRDSEERFRRLLNSTPDALLVVRKDGEICHVNDQTSVLFGHDRGELLGSKIELLVPERYREAHVGHRDDFFERSERHALEAVELIGLRKNGTEFPVAISFSPLVTDEGTFTIASVRDVTAQRRAADILLRAKEAAETANHELESFSYSVAHDLRAPLRSIDGFSQALLDDYGKILDAPGKDYLARVQGSARHMADLIDALLSLSRVARQELVRESVDLTSMARSILRSLAERDPKRRVGTSVAEGLTGFADPRLARVLLDNLLGNAWKFTAHSQNVRIEMGTRNDGTETVYFVRDNGAGFDMKTAGRLFTAFQRLHKSCEFEGTGIGLATAQRVVQRHGGRIWAESETGHGATFYFTLGENRPRNVQR